MILGIWKANPKEPQLCQPTWQIVVNTVVIAGDREKTVDDRLLGVIGEATRMGAGYVYQAQQVHQSEVVVTISAANCRTAIFLVGSAHYAEGSSRIIEKNLFDLLRRQAEAPPFLLLPSLCSLCPLW